MSRDITPQLVTDYSIKPRRSLLKHVSPSDEGKCLRYLVDKKLKYDIAFEWLVNPSANATIIGVIQNSTNMPINYVNFNRYHRLSGQFHADSTHFDKRHATPSSKKRCTKIFIAMHRVSFETLEIVDLDSENIISKCIFILLRLKIPPPPAWI